MANLSSNYSDELSSGLGSKQDLADLHVVVLSTSFIGILSVLTLVGNFMVLATFCMCKELRSITNYFLVSLSVADILTAVLSMPIFLVLRITNDKWNFPGGQGFAMIFGTVDMLCGTASIWNLCLVSLDRFLAISMPLKHMVILTPSRAVFVIIVAWALALGVSSLIHVTWAHKAYLIVTLSFFVPLALIVFSYVKIYQVKTATSSLRRTGGTKFKRDFRTARQMIIVIGSFIICWFGFFVVNVVLASRKVNPSPVILNLVKALTYLNSCINPLLFTFISQKFKIAFSQIFRCQKPDLRSATRHTNSTIRRQSQSRRNCYSVISSNSPSPAPNRRLLPINEEALIEKETCL
ncbi:predicted protein [Nematostella vectensis]|uniref:G-protein coupled receptors family 1 profile domain-containing protein n=2 Tax=Nematostella vectensis TaxID=45351 RepID=A7SRR1_NEMVE|nr:predicted protein [Nematostella vectensis]|eukprot:XP_001625708.1 predicted protein [Nematostella vectensis]